MFAARGVAGIGDCEEGGVAEEKVCCCEAFGNCAESIWGKVGARLDVLNMVIELRTVDVLHTVVELQMLTKLESMTEGDLAICEDWTNMVEDVGIICDAEVLGGCNAVLIPTAEIMLVVFSIEDGASEYEAVVEAI